MPPIVRSSLDFELDTLVRRVDEDRWLASRFAPRAVRKRLIALYALNYELARVSESVTQAAAGDIRLAWWREAIAAVHEHAQQPTHPVVAAYAEAHAAAPFAPTIVERMIEARRKDLDVQPFQTWNDACDYLDATAGGLIRLAFAACGQHSPRVFEDMMHDAGQAWGAAGLWRAERYWTARGRTLIPSEGGTVQRYIEMARSALSRLERRRAPQSFFPALGYVSLARLYLMRGAETAPLLSKQIRLIIAAATGRI